MAWTGLKTTHPSTLSHFCYTPCHYFKKSVVSAMCFSKSSHPSLSLKTNTTLFFLCHHILQNPFFSLLPSGQDTLVSLSLSLSQSFCIFMHGIYIYIYTRYAFSIVVHYLFLFDVCCSLQLLFFIFFSISCMPYGSYV